jgi:hypothetical protein
MGGGEGHRTVGPPDLRSCNSIGGGPGMEHVWLGELDGEGLEGALVVRRF